MCSFIIHSCNKIYVPTLSYGVGCCLHTTKSLSGADVCWPIQVLFLLPLSIGRSRWRGAYELDKIQGEIGRESCCESGHGGPGAVSSDSVRLMVWKLEERKGPFPPPLPQKLSTWYLIGFKHWKHPSSLLQPLSSLGNNRKLTG